MFASCRQVLDDESPDFLKGCVSLHDAQHGKRTTMTAPSVNEKCAAEPSPAIPYTLYMQHGGREVLWVWLFKTKLANPARRQQSRARFTFHIAACFGGQPVPAFGQACAVVLTLQGLTAELDETARCTQTLLLPRAESDCITACFGVVSVSCACLSILWEYRSLESR